MFKLYYIRIFTISTFFQFFSAANLEGQNPIIQNYKDFYGFGKYLFFENDFKRAAAELNKALSMHDLGSLDNSDSIKYLIGICYSNLLNYELSNKYLLKVSSTSPSLYSKAIIQSSKNYILSNNYDSAILFLKNMNYIAFTEDDSNKFSLLLASSHLLLRNPDMASRQLMRDNLIDSKMFSYALELERFEPKSALVAGLLSAIIPGTGKFYCGDLEAGLMSMFTIGLFGFRTITEYKRNGTSSINFWTFGLASLYFYSGNIYGSVISAKLFNEDYYNDYNIKVLDFVNKID